MDSQAHTTIKHLSLLYVSCKFHFILLKVNGGFLQSYKAKCFALFTFAEVISYILL